MGELDLLVNAIVKQAIVDYVKTSDPQEMIDIAKWFRTDGMCQLWFEYHSVDCETLIQKLNDMRKDS